MVEDSQIYKNLLEMSVPEQPLNPRKIVSVKEKGTRYLGSVRPPRNTVVFQIDGNIIIEGNKCDKLILSDDNDPNCCIGHFVELKGCDIKHAIQQLKSTLECPLFKDSSLSKKFARVVGNSFPSSAGNPIVEKAKIYFKRNYHCELRMLKSDQPDQV